MNARTAGVMIVVFLVSLLLPGVLRAQDTPPEVRSYIDQVTAGNVDEAREELSSLKEKYPDNPGVTYLEALLSTDGSVAARLYQSIVDSHPRCEWADAALYKVYQFYYALGLYKTADLKMAQLQRDYPDSKYLKGQSAVVEAAPAVSRHDTQSAPVVSPPIAAPPKEEPVVAPTTMADKAPLEHVPPSSVKTEKSAVANRQVSGGYTLQVGAFASKPNAERLQHAVAAMGYRVEVVTRVRTGKTMYHVWVGNYPTEAEARAAAAELREKHSMDAMLVAR